MTDDEAQAAYACFKGTLQSGYAKSNLTSDMGLSIAAAYQGWTRYSMRAYVSATHGGRFVQNYGNRKASGYGQFENAGTMPAGAVLAKDSFVVKHGKLVAGPMFVMEKMAAGFNADSGNWRYTLVMPTGKVIGTTNGKGSNNVEFCTGCHMAAEDTDSMMFLPEEYRWTF